MTNLRSMALIQLIRQALLKMELEISGKIIIKSRGSVIIFQKD